MKTILLFGAGKSATVLIHYLLEQAARENWIVKVVDAQLQLAQGKVKNAPNGLALSFDITDKDERDKHISEADIVISLLPPSLHIQVAQSCIEWNKNLLTASYVDEQMEALRGQIAQKGLLFLCEMGLDPGIDHMSAKKIIDEIQSHAGTITSFTSHCGGLIAPESDNNPWHYKISWNPRNIVNAGKDGALFKQNGAIKQLLYKELFSESRYVQVDDDLFCWYPNRDSLRYISLYGLDNCNTFIRTTLRHPDFIYGWKNIIDLKLTDESFLYETDGKTLADFFVEHLDRNQFSSWIEDKLNEHFKSTQDLLNNLVNLVELEENALEQGQDPVDNFMVVNEKGSLQQVDIEDLKNNAAASIAFKMHEAKLTLKQLIFLGLDDKETYINKGRCSAADVLLFALEKKLALEENDKDLVVMLHEIEYELSGEHFKIESALMIKGTDKEHTAMAKTVGLPLGIAAKLILNGTIKEKGLHIPISRQIYDPVLEELQKNGIEFTESTKPI